MDIALFWDPSQLAFDWQIAGGDLVVDNGLYTAVVLSICSDREANADDKIPDGTTDRRGVWMDTPVGAPGQVTPDFAGSRLWLLSRATQTLENLNRGITYLKECLQWGLDDGVFASVTVTGTLPATPQDAAFWAVAIAQQNADGTQATHSYDIFWSNTLGIAPPVLSGSFPSAPG
jgi:phage gp46-like protein